MLRDLGWRAGVLAVGLMVSAGAANAQVLLTYPSVCGAMTKASAAAQKPCLTEKRGPGSANPPVPAGQTTAEFCLYESIPAATSEGDKIAAQAGNKDQKLIGSYVKRCVNNIFAKLRKERGLNY